MNKPHYTFWVVAVAGLLWNLAGCMNYIMQTNSDSVAQMPEVYQLIINNRPAWATGSFAVAVFAGAVGCILLLLRRQVAVYLFVLSLLGIIGTAAFTMIVSGVVPVMVLTLLIGAALLWYATIVRRFGWLA
jgi:hypothetical protein